MIAALRSRNFNEFAQLLEEKSNVKYLENEEIINEINTSLQSLRAAIYGARGVIGDSYCIRSIIKCMEIYSPDIGIQSQGLNILYPQLNDTVLPDPSLFLDDPELLSFC